MSALNTPSVAAGKSDLKKPMAHGEALPSMSPGTMAKGPLDFGATGKQDRWGAVGCVVLLGFLGGCEWQRVFGWNPVLWRITVAAVLPALISLVFRLRWPARIGGAAVVSLVALAWFIAVGALHASVALVVPTPDAIRDIWDGLINGWAEILSVPLPVPADGEYLVLPVVLTWLTTLVGVELILRSRRPLAGVLPPVFAYALALLFGIGDPGNRVLGAGLFLLFILVVAGATARPIVTERRNDKGAFRRRAAEMGGCIAGIVVIAALIGPSLPFVGSSHPYDPRATRLPPETPATAINPLDQLSVWALHPNGPKLLTVHWTGQPQPIQLAVLDQYNTVNGWTSSGRFSTTGSQLPRPTGDAGETVSQQVTVGSIQGPWLPAAEWPARIDGVHALVDASTGILVEAAPARKEHYHVTSLVPSTPDCTLDQAVPPATTIPSIPAAIESMARTLTKGNGTPCAEASTLAAAFPTHFTFKSDAPSGSNIQVLLNFALGPAAQGGQTGTYEQAAATYALMADSLGMQARVVVGFHSGALVGGDTYAIRPEDAFAWDEVDFEGVGWIPFFPTLADGPTPKEDQTDEASSELRHNPNQTTPGAVPPKAKASKAQLHISNGSTLEVVGLTVGIVFLVGITLLLGSASTIWVVRRRRRRHRFDESDPRRRILGAWDESLDELATAGVRARRSDTVGEIALSGTERLGDIAAQSLEPLGRLSNAARYSDHPLTKSDADDAWHRAEEISALSGRFLGGWGRLRKAVDFRVLIPSRRG